MPDSIHAPFVAGLLAHLGRDGVLACSCGRTHRIGVAEVLVEPDALARAAELLFQRHGPRPSVWVLSDDNTEAAAGRWKSSLAGATVRSHVLPGAPRPVPSLELAGQLADEARRSPVDLVVGIGSGVISDLVKRVSLEVGRPSWCIATAPSVDAYSSATASLRVGGFHQTVPARTSDVIVCDLDVLARAPRVLLLAGLGDLLAKFVAHLDWNLSALVTGEHYCAVIAELALGSARMAVRAAGQLSADPIAAVASLTDAVLMSGFAMQAIGNSRPAASAEHTIAHLWETVHAVAEPRYDLHGILVGAATRMVLRGYEWFYPQLADLDPDLDQRRAALAAEPAWNDSLEPEMRQFADKIAGEMRLPSGGPASPAERIEAFRSLRTRLTELARPLLAELAAAVRLLENLGFPFALDALGIPAPLRMRPVRHVRLLRARYTTFDLAHELGCEPDLVGAIDRSQRPDTAVL
jgi:glycerol-1-phosphate dehydrogenase [NAD(P)+]